MGPVHALLRHFTAARRRSVAWGWLFGRASITVRPLPHVLLHLDVIMITQIVTHTPTWVWGLLLALLWLGLKQSVSRTASLRRVTVMPLVMTGL